MMIKCPNCGSDRIVTRDFAKKACGFLGILGGAATVTIETVGGAETGGATGSVVGPVGTAVGLVAGVMLSMLVRATSGGVTGAKLGEVIDDKILDNYQCLACNFTFSSKKP